MKPLVSVLISVYKEPVEWLKAALASILRQTYSNLEILITLDSPENDEAKAYLQQVATNDERVILIFNSKNEGLITSLNNMLRIASGMYLLRMDADDISVDQRIAQQIEFLECHEEVDLVGSNVMMIDERGGNIRPMFATKSEKINQFLFAKTPAFHPTWCFRRSALLKVSCYPNIPHAEDYAFLLSLLSQGGCIANIDEVLLEYRVSGDSISNSKSYLQFKGKEEVIRRYRNGTLSTFQVPAPEAVIGGLIYKMHMFGHSYFMKANNTGQRRYFLQAIVSPYYMVHFVRVIKAKLCAGDALIWFKRIRSNV
jgi:glycosyltransferase involved in cell wall biosynthesis